jgi:hypothetical protein
MELGDVQLAIDLGVRIDVAQLRSVKIGGLRRIPHTAIEEYLNQLMTEVV